jgi:hypothetical protein
LEETLALPLTGPNVESPAMVDESAEPGLQEAWRSLSPAECDAVWVRIADFAGHHLRPECFKSEEGDSTMALHVSWAVGLLLVAFTQHLQNSSKKAPQALLQVALLCHEILLHVPDAKKQYKLADALERICALEIEGCEQLFGGLVLFRLDKCGSPKVTCGDVNQLYKIRHMLSELHWEHETIEAVKLRILRCIGNTNFLVKKHGSDLVAMFYVVHAGFSSQVNSAVKDHIVQSRGQTEKAYAMSLWKALHLARDSALQQLEQIVQEWIVIAVRANAKYADKARTVLDEIHRHHLEPLERELLCKCYAPVLWRSLKVANGQVRENAAKLLHSVFPLVPPDSTVEAQESETMKQLRFLRETLEDKCENVRRAGVMSTCLVLKSFWDYIPKHECAQLLTIMKDQCAADKKSSAVRAAIVEGFECLLENPCTHPTMEVVLSEVGRNFFLDRSPVVRSAFAHLLGKLSQCRTISMQKVVSQEEILHGLVIEQALSSADAKRCDALSRDRSSPTEEAVAQRLANFLAPSLFTGSMQDQVQCCHELLGQYPLALRAMIRQTGDAAQLPARVKLAVALYREGRQELQRLAEGAPTTKKQPWTSVLHVAGLLLDGVCAAADEKKKRSGDKHAQPTPDLRPFLKAHVKEEDFLYLLRSKDAASVPFNCLWEDLLFVLCEFDASDFPGVAELVRAKLHDVVCEEDSSHIVESLLLAFLRLALRWDILDDTVDLAMERLVEAASQFSSGQAFEKDFEGPYRIVNAIFRDSILLHALLPIKAETFRQVVPQLTEAFCNAWVDGFERLPGARKGSDQAVLGPCSELWPKVVMLLLRIAQHLRHRRSALSFVDTTLPLSEQAEHVQASKAAVHVSGSEISDACRFKLVEKLHLGLNLQLGAFYTACELRHRCGGDISKLDRLNQLLRDGIKFVPEACRSLQDEMHTQISAALGSTKVTELLQQLESAAGRSGDGPPPKRSRKSASVPLPSDIDSMLQVYVCFLEAANASHYLSSLNDVEDTSPNIVLEIPGGVQGLEKIVWRWAVIADDLNPQTGSSRSSDAWVACSFSFQQRLRTKVMSLRESISGACRLCSQVSDSVPAEAVDLKNFLSPLLWHFEFKDDPEICIFLQSFLKDSGAQLDHRCTDSPGSEPIEIHGRLVDCVKEMLPSFRRLRSKLLPDAAPAPPLTECDPSSHEHDGTNPDQGLSVRGEDGMSPDSAHGKSFGGDPVGNFASKRKLGIRHSSVCSREECEVLPSPCRKRQSI